MRLTHHAVEQFASRWGGTEEQLRALAASAAATKARTPRGQEIWRCGEGGVIRLVVKRDPSARDPICVTVLPPTSVPDEREPGIPLDELLEDLVTPSVVDTVPPDDAHLKAAAAEVDEARAEVGLASEVFAAARSFVLGAKERLSQAKARLRQLQDTGGPRG